MKHTTGVAAGDEIQELDLGPIPQATERRCYRCRVTRPLSMFYIEMERKRAARDGRSRFLAPCRVCQREINTARRAEKQAHSDAVKLAAGCADCGIRRPHPEIYDFDHRPGEEKRATVASLLTKGTLEEMIAEIAKCDVVCANCHRIRTRQRPAGHFGGSKRAG